jgi:hypothetical protein
MLFEIDHKPRSCFLAAVILLIGGSNFAATALEHFDGTAATRNR